jgi:hypothetical protein
MSDPRLDADIIGKNATYLSAYYDNSGITYSATSNGGSTKVGLAVTLSSDGTISTAADGELVLGKLIKVEPDGYCTVQVGGGMELAGGTGATLTVGYPIVGAVDGTGAEGYIRIAAHATTTETILARGRIWDNDDTTAVQVYL